MERHSLCACPGRALTAGRFSCVPLCVKLPGLCTRKLGVSVGAYTSVATVVCPGNSELTPPRDYDYRADVRGWREVCACVPARLLHLTA